jgi:hypothetical protein
MLIGAGGTANNVPLRLFGNKREIRGWRRKLKKMII